jgi:hypothetical protein
MGVAKGMRAYFYFLDGDDDVVQDSRDVGAVSLFDHRTKVGRFGSARTRQNRPNSGAGQGPC